MTGRVQSLAWDTEFFGFPIGRADLDGADRATLEAIEEEARDLGIRCLYGALEPIDNETPYIIQTFGHRLVEVALTFRRPAGPFTPKPTTSTVRLGTPDDLPKLADAIATLSPWSRFAADPRFPPDSAERMFHAWVKRAAEDGQERMLLVAEDATGVTGLSTYVRTPTPRIDLMGVITQGSGASWALMDACIAWADGGPIEGGPCVARNLAPLRFVEHCGFTIVRTQYLFHRWLDEDLRLQTVTECC